MTRELGRLLQMQPEPEYLLFTPQAIGSHTGIVRASSHLLQLMDI